MTIPCERLAAFWDGELSTADADAFQLHLAGCSACAAELHNHMVLAALTGMHRADLAARSSSRPTRARALRRWGPLVSALALAAGVLGFLLHRTAILPPAAPLALETAPERRIDVRFTYPAADGYRPYGADRGAQAPSDAVPMATLARLEAEKETNGLAAALALSGDLRRAAAVLAAAAPSPDVQVDRAALALQEGHPDRALGLLDGVLAKAPNHRQALWNEAVAFEALHLPYVAAETWGKVAALNEPGWSEEAKQRGAALTRADDAQLAEWTGLSEALKALTLRGELPSDALVDAHPSNVRAALYDAVNAAPSRARLDTLRPLVLRLDGAEGPLLRHLDRLDARTLARRARFVDAYAALVDQGPRGPETDAFIAELKKAGEDDLFFGAVDRSYAWREYATDLARIASARRDPWMRLIAERGRAKGEEATGNYARAERIFRDAVTACDALHDGALCARLEYQRVLDLWRAHHVREAEHAAIAAFARADAHSNPVHYMLRTVLAKSAVQRGEYPLARAYALDAMLREPTFCTGRADAHEISAEAWLSALDFGAAKRELSEGPQCDGSYEPARARALAVLAREGERLPETDALETSVAAGYPQWTEGQRLYMDAVRGNLILGTDPARATALLDATATHAAALTSNSDARAARDWSLVSLGWEAAMRGDGASVIARFTRNAGLDDPRCTVVLGVDYERSFSVVEDAAGTISVHADPHGTRLPPPPDALVGPGVVASLRSCAQVNVLASPPLHGMPGLLPGDLAWAYRVVAPRAPSTGASPPQRALIVSNVEPPPDLDLPPLKAGAPGPSPGVATTWLHGSQATVENVRRELARATEVQIHTHGLVDIGESDAPLLVLTPDERGTWALSADDVASIHLEGHPVVVLGACRAARAAPSLHEQWSLPAAFIRAGARSVIAAAEAIPDEPAAEFFDGVLRRVRAGSSPATALRDQRLAVRERPGSAWVDSLLLFE